MDDGGGDPTKDTVVYRLNIRRRIVILIVHQNLNSNITERFSSREVQIVTQLRNKTFIYLSN